MNSFERLIMKKVKGNRENIIILNTHIIQKYQPKDLEPIISFKKGDLIYKFSKVHVSKELFDKLNLNDKIIVVYKTDSLNPEAIFFGTYTGKYFKTININ